MHRDYVIYHNSQGHQLTSLRERPQKEAQEMCVVLCHGRSVGKDELGAFVKLSDTLIDAGYDVFRFDFRGHGMSSLADYEMTIETEKEDIETTLDFLSKKYAYKKFILVAASFAGCAAIPFVAETKYQIDKFILRNAICDPEHYINPPTEYLMNKTQKRREEIEKKGYAVSGTWKFRMGKEAFEQLLVCKPYTFLEKITLPITMIHGDNDKLVPYNLSQKHASLHDHIDLITIEGAGHGFHSEPFLSLACQACLEVVLS